jgi:hypothetical protein
MYLTGSGWANKSKDILKSINADAVYSWLDNYCRQNPLEKFPSAVMTLALELEIRAGRQ